jgi:hypothetical protein
MGLTQFAVTGNGEYDADSGEVLQEAEPSRSLIRYLPDGSELFVQARVNPRLLAAATSLPVLLLEPTQRADEVMLSGSLTALGSVRNYELLERICDDLITQACPACYLAEQAGNGRRDFYFATEDVDGLQHIAHQAATELGLPLTIRETRLSDVAATILPIELIGELDLPIPADQLMRTIRFEFSGAGPSLERLRHDLEGQGFRYVSIELATSELRMVKEVPIDGPGFLGVLRDIVPMARSMRCAYRGTETIGGSEQFALARPLPQRYAARESETKGTWRRMFGRSS